MAPKDSNTIPNLHSFVELLNPTVFGRESILEAPAKLNLRLKVLGRRADGYHLLSMLNASISVCDTVTVALERRPGCEVSMESEGAVDILSKDNLVTKAFVEFWRAMEYEEAPVGMRAHVAKLIPIGAGLGGGSSDAGAVLRFLVAKLREPIQRHRELSDSDFFGRLMRAATKVGADVPYAYSGGVCWATGIGDVLKSLHVPELWSGEVLVAVPPEPVPTLPFYDFFRRQHPVLPVCRDEMLEKAVEQGLGRIPFALLENDFERDVVAMVPAVGRAISMARSFFPETTSLTGSGSAVFSLVQAEHGQQVEAYREAMDRAGVRVFRAALK